MSSHLDEREISAAVAGLGLAGGLVRHLESCLDCRRRVVELTELIGRRRAEQTSREPDWEAARAAVLARLPGTGHEGASGGRRLRWWRPLAAAAAVAAAALAVRLLLPGRTPAVPSESEVAVEEILAEVDAVLADDSIPGFEIIDPGLETLSRVAANGSS